MSSKNFCFVTPFWELERPLRENSEVVCHQKTDGVPGNTSGLTVLVKADAPVVSMNHCFYISFKDSAKDHERSFVQSLESHTLYPSEELNHCLVKSFS